MKGIFGRGTRPVGSGGGVASGGALASFAVPPFPQSTPDRLLSLHVCAGGLLILPRPAAGSSGAHSRNSSASSAAAALGDAAPLATTDEARAQDVAHERRREGAAPTAGALVEWGRKGKVAGISAKEAAAELERSKPDAEGAETLCYGVVGILRVFNAAYLLVIVSRTHAGDFLHTSCPVYRSTGVLSIPLEQPRAREALHAEALRQAKVPAPRTDAATSDEESSEDESDLDDVHTPAPVEGASHGAAAAARAVGEAATLRPARSGPWLKRLAGRAASDGGAPGAEAAAEQTEDVDVPSAITPAVAAMFDPAGATVSAVTADEAKEMTADERYHEASKAELEEKVVRETAKQYSRGEMWFAYDFDLTTPLQRKEQAAASAGHARAPSASSETRVGAGPPWDEPNQRLPLWRRADRRFWHNEHLSRDFVQAGLHGLVLPLMQGFFQIVPLPLGEAGADTPPKSPDVAGEAMDAVSLAAASERLSAYILLVSRRSKERAGLRYQRRGIADDGTVANYVETEQILLVKRPGSTHTLSFVQFRGSIPLFWSQNPFNLKPPPILERSANDNTQACKRHFDEQTARYGSVTCINLAEQGGKEGQITEAYRKAAEAYGGQVQYVAFDFHKECAGMKFENVARLLGRMKDEEVLGKMDCFWRTSGSSGAGAQTLCRQQGAFRVSCLDCLDRTNVVQSAFARYMLGVQLERLGIAVPSVRGERDEAFDFAFNDSWANNGDMVSQIYAGTRALKGDFTRTGKRNLLGMMNDATASVYRMVQGAVTDFFKQTVMDFQYGQMSLTALERYNDELVAQDPSEHQKLARVRAHAIDNCAALVLSDGEEKLGGWTLFSPIEANRVQSPKLEEKVVLLTSKALYSCGWDFTAEKLVEFSRILLGDIVAIKKGVYIIAPKEAFLQENHWGLVISYLNEEKRLNTASMKNISPAQAAVGGATNFLAFRAVVDDFVGTLALPQIEPPAEKSAAASGGGKPKLLFRRGPTSAPMAARSVSAESMDALDGEVTSHKIVDRIVDIIVARCAQAGACDADDLEGFVFEDTIQSLAEARANASMFAPLIEGLKRRLWL